MSQLTKNQRDLIQSYLVQKCQDTASWIGRSKISCGSSNLVEGQPNPSQWASRSYSEQPKSIHVRTQFFRRMVRCGSSHLVKGQPNPNPTSVRNPNPSMHVRAQLTPTLGKSQFSSEGSEDTFLFFLGEWFGLGEDYICLRDENRESWYIKSNLYDWFGVGGVHLLDGQIDATRSTGSTVRHRAQSSLNFITI